MAKILLVNGSPTENGCTYTALCEVASALKALPVKMKKKLHLPTQKKTKPV